MNVTATELAKDSKKVLDEVIYKGQTAQINRHGKPVAEIHPSPSVSGDDMMESLRKNPFTAEEAAELSRAIKEGSKALTDGHRD